MECNGVGSSVGLKVRTNEGAPDGGCCDGRAVLKFEGALDDGTSVG